MHKTMCAIFSCNSPPHLLHPFFLFALHPAGVQGCMYKKMDAADRCEQLQRIDFQLDVLEKLVAGPFVAGGCCCLNQY
jgi:hypothetical protein